MSKLVKSTFILMTILALIISFMPINHVSANAENVTDVENTSDDANDTGVKGVSSLQNNKVYKIKNVATGKYLNVNYGTDANGTNVTQFTGDGSIEQKWKAVYSNGSWKFYAMCSSNGTNRVLDVLRDNGSASGGISTGNNIDIWAPNDADAQSWTVSYQNNGSFIIYLTVSDYSMMVCSYGSGNGSGSGTSSTSNGNVFIGSIYSYDSNIHPYWEFIEVN